MANVIAFLNECETTGKDAMSQLASNNIKVNAVESRNLWILNYEQVETNPQGFKKTHPVIRECRNLVVRNKPWRVLSHSFTRFFNFKEDVDETVAMLKAIADGRVVAHEKFDGSLITVAYFDDQWNIFTRGAMADTNPFRGLVFDTELSTFGSRVRKYVNLDNLDKSVTYVFELCTPYAHVTRYDREFVALLAANRDGKELDITNMLPNMPHPETFDVKSMDDLYARLAAKPADYEGYVLSYIDDGIVHRMKVKQASYVALHHMVSNHYNFNDLVLVVLTGEIAEVTAYIPQYTKILMAIKEEVERICDTLHEFWIIHKDMSRKDFAKAVGKRDFSWLLFDLIGGKGLSVRELMYNQKYSNKIAAVLEPIIRAHNPTSNFEGSA